MTTMQTQPDNPSEGLAAAFALVPYRGGMDGSALNDKGSGPPWQFNLFDPSQNTSRECTLGALSVAAAAATPTRTPTR